MSIEDSTTAQAPCRVAAVVVTYNRRELLMECIERLRGQEGLAPGVALEVLVIDNASTDGTAEAVAALAADSGTAVPVRYCSTGANLGGAGGFSFGMREAVERGFDVAWVMDDDCMANPDCLAALRQAAEGLEGGFGWLSSVARWKDGSPCRMNIQRHPLFRDIEDFSPAVQPATLASFVSLLVPVPVIRRFGLPIKEFFIWTDDWEFTRRVSRELPCYVVGGSVVTHASATNNPGNIMTDGPDRLDRYELVYRNDVVLYRGEGLRGWAYVVARGLYHTVGVLRCQQPQKARRIGIIWRSTLRGIGFRPPIEHVG